MYSKARLFVLNDNNTDWELLNSMRWVPCRDMIMPGGKLNDWKHSYFGNLPDTCPVNGTHTIDVKIPVNREKWGPALKMMIAKYIPRGNKYRLTFSFYFKDKSLAGMFVVEFKMYQKAKQVEPKKVMVHYIDEIMNDE